VVVVPVVPVVPLPLPFMGAPVTLAMPLLLVPTAWKNAVPPPPRPAPTPKPAPQLQTVQPIPPRRAALVPTNAQLRHPAGSLRWRARETADAAPPPMKTPLKALPAV